MRNGEIARVFREIAAYLEMEDVAFKPRAYEKAAETMEALAQPIEEIYAAGGVKALGKIPGVGKSCGEKIREYLDTGRVALHEELHAKTPVDVSGLLGVEGLGPKGIKALYEHLGIRSVVDLEEAARDGRIRSLPRFGEKMEQKILRGIGFLQSGSLRLPIGKALPLARELEARLRMIAGVREVAIAGSIRRRRETIGDLDLLAVAEAPERVMDAFVSHSQVVAVHGHGPTKSSIRLAVGIDADLRVVPEESFGAALQYFTGSKDHGVACRKIAIEKGLS
ncbi:MAG: helix-hairpin-helix domain-containing protein [Candidatus Binatia bacterium]